MSTDVSSKSLVFSRYEQLRLGRDVIRDEGRALLDLSGRLTTSFADAVEMLYRCRGGVIVVGMGKAGLVGRKLVATLASTGTPSHFLHPAEAVHGDLGRVRAGDAALVLSFSGETEEVVRILPSIAEIPVPIVAITGRPDSHLGRRADVVLDLGRLHEACELGLAPTTSTTAMMAMGDALALVLSRMRRFGSNDFARFHPAGSLGRRLAHVEDVMRPLTECRVARHTHSVRQVFIQVSKPGRRTGAIILTDEQNRLTGVFTDSDLARLLERKQDHAIDRPIGDVMTLRPRAVARGTTLGDAVRIFVDAKISELPVTDDEGHPVGLLDVTDIISLLPREVRAAEFLAQSAESDDEGEPTTVRFSNPGHGEPRNEA